MTSPRLDRQGDHLAKEGQPDDSVSIEHYMAQWCNTIHQPQPETSLQDSPTPASDLTPKEELEESTTSDELDSPYSPKELENLQSTTNT